MLASCYRDMEMDYRNSGRQLPRNRDHSSDNRGDKIIGELDCAAIEFMHAEIFDAANKQDPGTTGKITSSLIPRGVYLPREEIDFAEWQKKSDFLPGFRQS